MQAARAPDGHARILALDSGIGGLGIAGAIRAAVPGAALTYLADHGFFPYGARDGAVLASRIVDLVGRLLAREPFDLVVIACNTASTVALEPLRRAFDVAFAGCVPPVKWAAATSRTRTIGLLATEATVGRAYVHALSERFAPDCRLIAHGARDLAAYAERRFLGAPAEPDLIAREVARLFGQPGGDAIDAVCLGCTHYGLLLDELSAAAPASVAWLDPAGPVARHAASLLSGRTGPAADADAHAALTTAWPEDPGPLVRAFARAGFLRLGLL